MPPPPSHRPLPAILIAIALVLAVIAVYAPTRHHEFVNLDDPAYVVHNPHVRAGLTVAGLRWALERPHLANWQPLTWLSHMVDCELWGLDPGAHHRTSVALHAAAAVLLFFALLRMSGAVGCAAFVAALFALHPLHVESVAWVSARKDVLSTLFGFLALLAWAGYARSGSRRWYAAALAAFAASLLAKQMLVTLPFLLVLLDLWPLGRIPAGPWRASLRGAARLLPEKLPLFALALAGSLAAFVAQRSGGAMRSLVESPLAGRLANSATTCLLYLGQALWPSGLCAYYPYPAAILGWQVAGSLAVLFGLTALSLALARRHPYLLVGWLWYLGTLVPVIGIVQIGGQRMADRYTYVPLVGLALAASWLVASLAGPSVRWRRLLAVVALAAIVPLSFAARLQAGHWRDSVALFEHALEVTRANALAHANLGTALEQRGETGRAVREYERALEVDPEFADALANLGIIALKRGDAAGAAAYLERALASRPDHVAAWYGLAWLRDLEGDTGAARAGYEAVLALEPDHVAARNSLGVLFARGGDLVAAGEQFELALEADPGDPDAFANLAQLALVYAQAGRLGEARATARLALDRASAAGRDDVVARIRSQLGALLD